MGTRHEHSIFIDLVWFGGRSLEPPGAIHSRSSGLTVRMFNPTKRSYPVMACLSLSLSGCMDKPLSLDQHFQNYETLAQAVADETQRGQIVDFEETKGKMRQLMAELGVRRVRHDQNGAFVLLSGQSNIITGQFSYLYKLGDAEIDLSMHARDGVTRAHVHGRWYIEKAYFD